MKYTLTIIVLLITSFSVFAQEKKRDDYKPGIDFKLEQVDTRNRLFVNQGSIDILLTVKSDELNVDKLTTECTSDNYKRAIKLTAYVIATKEYQSCQAMWLKKFYSNCGID